MDKKIAINNLKLVRDTITEMNKRYFLIDGTLLGAIRGNDFIEHDSDTDVGVFLEEWNKKDIEKLKKLLKKQGLNFCHQYGEMGKHLELAFKNEVKTDIFFYKKKYNKRIFTAYVKEKPIYFEYPASYFDHELDYIFKGEMFKIPAEPIKVLEHKYGSDWQTPIIKWNWATSPKNKI